MPIMLDIVPAEMCSWSGYNIPGAVQIYQPAQPEQNAVQVSIPSLILIFLSAL